MLVSLPFFQNEYAGVEKKQRAKTTRSHDDSPGSDDGTDSCSNDDLSSNSSDASDVEYTQYSGIV